MTDLHLALFALGAIIIAVVILFNWWQEQRIRRETVRRFEGPIEDALMVDSYYSEPDGSEDIDVVTHTQAPTPPVERKSVERKEGQKVEPTFSVDPIPEAIRTVEETVVEEEIPEYKPVITDTAVDGPGLSSYAQEETPATAPAVSPEKALEPLPQEDVEPATEVEIEPGVSKAFVAEAAPAPSGKLPPNVDEKIDLIAVITLTQPASGEKLREAMLPLPHLDKPSQWMGLSVDSLWRHFTKDQEDTRFTLIVGSLQLADRSGAVTSATLQDFQQKAEESAARLSASLEWLGPPSPQRYAQELDQFCIEVDVLVRLHLITVRGGLFAGTKLRGLAEAGGLSLQDDGTFHYVNDNNELQFSLLNETDSQFTVEALRTQMFQAVSLHLDIARVDNFLEAFSKMAILARRMEQGLGARLVDDNQRTLGEAELEKIRQQLKKIHSTMMTHGIAPGSPAALRLFS